MWGKGDEYTGFWRKNLRKDDYLKNPGVDGRMILKQIFEKVDGDLDWIDLAQDREKWRAVLKAEMNFRIP